MHARTHGTLPYLQYLAAVRGAVDVLAGLVHAQRHTVEQDHHDANPLEPRTNRNLGLRSIEAEEKYTAIHMQHVANWAAVVK